MLGEQRNQNHTGFWMNIFWLGHLSFKFIIIQIFGAHFWPLWAHLPSIPPILLYQLSKLHKNVSGRCCRKTFPVFTEGELKHQMALPHLTNDRTLAHYIKDQHRWKVINALHDISSYLIKTKNQPPPFFSNMLFWCESSGPSVGAGKFNFAQWPISVGFCGSRS